MRGGDPIGALEQRPWRLILNGDFDLADPRFDFVTGDLPLIGPSTQQFLDIPRHPIELHRGESGRPLFTALRLGELHILLKLRA